MPTKHDSNESTSDDKEEVVLDNSVKKCIESSGMKIVRFIGKGSYSKVFLATWTEMNSRPVALKLIDTSKRNEYIRRFLPRETEIVRLIQHDNCVRVFAVTSHAEINTVCMVTEFCDHDSILAKVKKLRRIPEHEAKFLFRQLIEALKYLETKQILHRDLKCENVFLDRYDNVKLGDFGFARVLKQGEKSNTFCGSKAYVAPEILRAAEYSGNGVDIWSAGIVLYVATTGVMPYDDRNVRKMIDKQLSHKIKFPRLPLSHDLRCMIYAILHPFPPSRPSLNDMLNLDWMKGVAYRIRSESDVSTPQHTPLESRKDIRRIATGPREAASSDQRSREQRSRESKTSKKEQRSRGSRQ